MCIEFAKGNGAYDFLWTAPINLIGNGLVLSGVAAGAAIVSSVALKALGYSGPALAITKTLSMIAGTIGIGMAVLGAASFIIITGIFVSALMKR